jgi:hypothetical protein
MHVKEAKTPYRHPFRSFDTCNNIVPLVLGNERNVEILGSLLLNAPAIHKAANNDEISARRHLKQDD